MRRALFLLSAAFAGCEDGPEQIFQPNNGNPTEQNGYGDFQPWIQEGKKPYVEDDSGDAAGRAEFCDDNVTQELIQEMVRAPILPNESVGGVPLWDPDGGPTNADSLLGPRQENKFCDPWYTYLNAYSFGPTEEVIVIFNEQTRLVEGIAAFGTYLGTLEGDFLGDDTATVTEHAVIKNREFIRIGDRQLNRYAQDSVSDPSSWLDHDNITDLWRMVRQHHFRDDVIVDESFDCVEAKLCDIIYEVGAGPQPQYTWIILQDSGVEMLLTPDGRVYYVIIWLVRQAPFEKGGTMDFVRTTGFDFGYASVNRPGCTFGLAEGLTFGQFRSRCFLDADEATESLKRVDYVTETARDASDVHFNGVTIGFLHPIAERGALRDGQAPADDDTMYFVEWTRSLDAAVTQWVPRQVAVQYAAELIDRLGNSLRDPDPSDGVGVATHPFHPDNFTLDVPPAPQMLDTPQRIGELLVDPPGDVDPTYNFVTTTIERIHAMYDQLTPVERDMVDPRVLDPVYLIEPLTLVILNRFSNGYVYAADGVVLLRSTDDHKWSIGISSFRYANEPHRLIVQYSLNFDALTAVTVERGLSAGDVFLNGLSTYLGGGTYYTFDLHSRADNPYSIEWGDGPGEAPPFTLTSFDRQLAMHSLTAYDPATDGEVPMQLPGESILDGAGYSRQIRGQRWEFVPSDVVTLAGKETSVSFWIHADGTIGRIGMGNYKGSAELCQGLPIAYGDDVRQAVLQYQQDQGTLALRGCEVVYNYSANGNVLDEVVSLRNKVSIVTVAGRAVSAAVWR